MGKITNTQCDHELPEHIICKIVPQMFFPKRVYFSAVKTFPVVNGWTNVTLLRWNCGTFSVLVWSWMPEAPVLQCDVFQLAMTNYERQRTGYISINFQSLIWWYHRFNWSARLVDRTPIPVLPLCAMWHYAKISMVMWCPTTFWSPCHHYPCTPHKSHEASDKYPTQCTILWQKCAHMCTFLSQNGALWDMGLVHCGICAIILTYLVIISYRLNSNWNEMLHMENIAVRWSEYEYSKCDFKQIALVDHKKVSTVIIHDKENKLRGTRKNWILRIKMR